MNVFTDLLQWSQHYPTLSICFTLFLGLCFGSFINVVAYRLPIMMKRQWFADCQALQAEVKFKDTYPKRFNLCLPRSTCPHCETMIAWHHNIPILSFLWLRGKCGSCSKPISKKYPFTEALTGLVLASLALVKGIDSWFPAFAFLGMALITLTLIDLDEMILPDEIVFPLIWIGLLFNTITGHVAAEDAIIGAIAGYLSLWSVYWCFKLTTGKEGLGYGDFKLLAALGAWLGWQMLPLIIVLASVSGVVISVPLLLKQKKGLQQAIPFGPYLSIAGWITCLYGSMIMTWYLDGWMR